MPIIETWKCRDRRKGLLGGNRGLHVARGYDHHRAHLDSHGDSLLHLVRRRREPRGGLRRRPARLDLRLAHSSAANRLVSYQVVLMTVSSSTYQIGTSGALRTRTLLDNTSADTTATITFCCSGKGSATTSDCTNDSEPSTTLQVRAGRLFAGWSYPRSSDRDGRPTRRPERARVRVGGALTVVERERTRQFPS